MFRDDNFNGSEIMEVLEIHHHPQLMDQCCTLMDMEWPRSKTARLRSLKMSCDNLPTCLVLVQSCEVIGHSKISPLPSLSSGCFLESVIIHPKHRGKGLGKFLITRAEDYVKSRGLETVYLSTRDKQGFYSKLGYKECEPVQHYGGCVLARQHYGRCVLARRNLEMLPSNKTNHSNFDRAPSTSSIPNTVPLPLPPPPPPPPLPKPSNSKKQATCSVYTFMKKDL